MWLGVPELIIIAAILIVPVIGLVLIGLLTMAAGKRARRFGYGSTREYLRAAPRTD